MRLLLLSNLRTLHNLKKLVFKIILAILSPLYFHVNFRTTLSVSAKVAAEILIEFRLNL